LGCPVTVRRSRATGRYPGRGLGLALDHLVAGGGPIAQDEQQSVVEVELLRATTRVRPRLGDDLARRTGSLNQVDRCSGLRRTVSRMTDHDSPAEGASRRERLRERERLVAERESQANVREAGADQREVDLETRETTATAREERAFDRDRLLDERKRLLDLHALAADDRDRQADHREAIAVDRALGVDEQERLADLRESAADARDRIADQREIDSELARPGRQTP